jgi:hypothetical protein
MKDWRHALSVFRDELAFVTGHAPDRFPKEDFLPPEEQSNLENSYQRLSEAFHAFVEAYGTTPDVAKWRAAIDESYDLFKKGEKQAGTRRLNDLYNEIWSTKEIANRRPPRSSKKKND